MAQQLCVRKLSSDPGLNNLLSFRDFNSDIAMAQQLPSRGLSSDPGFKYCPSET